MCYNGLIYHIGCVDVVGCVRCEELTSWEAVPEGVSTLAFLTFLSLNMISIDDPSRLCGLIYISVFSSAGEA